jgi:hypothetical protein
MLDKDPSKRPTASTLFIEIADTDAAVSFVGRAVIQRMTLMIQMLVLMIIICGPRLWNRL